VTYAAAALYLLGMIQMDGFFVMAVSTGSYERYSPAVRATTRVLVVLLWPTYPAWVLYGLMRDTLKGFR
jgi:hypothetical protein